MVVDIVEQEEKKLLLSFRKSILPKNCQLIVYYEYRAGRVVVDMAEQETKQLLLLESQFPHKSVNSFVTLATIKDTLTDLCGSWLVQNDF